MKVIAKTGEYTIYQKRSERYAVQSSAKKWINGDGKVAILREHNLIAAPAVKAPEPVAEAVTEEGAGEQAAADEAPKGD